MRRSDTLSKCADCRYVFYCDRGCQREAWSMHKPECKCLQNVAPRIVPDCARMLARLIMKLNKGGDHVKGFYTSRHFRRWRDLMTREWLIDCSDNDWFVNNVCVIFRQIMMTSKTTRSDASTLNR